MMILRDPRAQSTIEFTFGMIVILFLIYGTVRVFRWTGMDLAQRRFTQDTSLNIPIIAGGQAGYDPVIQLNMADDRVQPISAVYNGSITGN
jgi:hypothetical protein